MFRQQNNKGAQLAYNLKPNYGGKYKAYPQNKFCS
jgi:hypothetical protein